MNTSKPQRDRATEPRKATEAAHAIQASEPLSQGATHATQATQAKPVLFTPIDTIGKAVQLSLKGRDADDCLFLFARALKAFQLTLHRTLPDKELSAAFSQWWQQAQATLPPGSNFDESRLLFLDMFQRVHSPLGADTLAAAIERARTAPPPPEAARYGTSPALQHLLAVCHQLQLLNGHYPFFISVRDAASVMGITDPKRANKLLSGLVHDGVLELIEPGRPGGPHASRYRFKRTPASPPPAP